MTRTLNSPFRIPGRLLAGAALLAAAAAHAVEYSNGEIREQGVVTTEGVSEPLIITSGEAEQQGVISGGGSISKQGAGSLILSGENTFEQGTFLEAGTLRLGNDEALGEGLITINGGALGTVAVDDVIMLENAVQVKSDFAIDARGGGGALEFMGAVDLGSANRTITLTSEGLACFGGGISGANGFSLVAGPGVTATQAMFCDMNSNTFAGTLRVGSGVVLELAKVMEAIAISGDLQIDAGAAVEVWGEQQFSATSDVEVNGLLTGYSGMENTFNTLTGSGTIDGVNGDTFVINSGNFTGTITNDLAIRKESSGTLALSGTNTYNGGTVVNGGTLEVKSANALGTGEVAVANNGTLRVDAGFRLNPANTVTLENNRSATFGKDFAVGEALSNFGAIRSSGPNMTEAQILSGTASGGYLAESTFAITPSTVAANDVYRISDVFSLTGTGSDVFVLQLSYTQTAYDAAALAGLYESELELILGRLANGEWVPVGSGLFVEGAWNSSYTAVGTYGVDTTSNVVWAVTDQGGEFSVVPEPSTWVLLGLGLAFVLVRLRRARVN